MYGPQQVGLVYKSKCHLPISDALTLDLEESYNRNSRYSKKHYHFSILLLHYVHPLLNAAQFQSLILVGFGSAGLWDNGPRFPPFCILASAFCGALPALHLQVNVLQVVLIDDYRVLDVVHDHVLECEILGIPASSLVRLDPCSIGCAVELHCVYDNAGHFSSRVVIS